MTWLVTGGAGYIGSHVVRCFLESGRDVVVIDDLSSGHRSFVPEGVPLVEGSVVDPSAVEEALTGGHVARRRRGDGRRPPGRASSTPGSRCSGRCTPTSRT